MGRDLIVRGQYQMSNEWNYLVEDCKAIISQRIKNSRMEVILAYAEIGNRIVEDPLYKKFGKGNQKFLSPLFKAIGISGSSGYFAIEFYEKFIKKYMPDSKDVSNALETSMQENFLDEGDNISWFKIVNKYLSEPKKEIMPLPKGQWDVFYADPPWEYGDKGGYVAVDLQYPTMCIKELCNMGVEDIVADNAVLFLWVTVPILPECFPVVEAWGFKYRSLIVWDKVLSNWGHYWSIQCELLLLCIKGSFPRQNEEMEQNIKMIKRPRAHSEKPAYFRDEIIEKMYPHGKKIELFARYDKEKAKELTKRGWVLWGNEIPED